MFDPALPANNADLVSAVMRSQLTGLKALIDAIASISAAMVDSTSTLPPGSPAGVSVTVDGNTLHFTFEIPQGDPGNPGDPGPPGEVSSMQLNDAIQTTSANSNSVAELAGAISDPPQQMEVQAIADKLDELILALRRT
jgi:hypothetical protein